MLVLSTDTHLVATSPDLLSLSPATYLLTVQATDQPGNGKKKKKSSKNWSARRIGAATPREDVGAMYAAGNRATMRRRWSSVEKCDSLRETTP